MDPPALAGLSTLRTGAMSVVTVGTMLTIATSTAPDVAVPATDLDRRAAVAADLLVADPGVGLHAAAPPCRPGAPTRLAGLPEGPGAPLQPTPRSAPPPPETGDTTTRRPMSETAVSCSLQATQHLVHTWFLHLCTI